MASRLSVDIFSDWPPDRKKIPIEQFILIIFNLYIFNKTMMRS